MGDNMKKIINGKKYDTETARMVGCFVWGKNKEDVNYSVEILFCKKTGEYFLYEEDNIIPEYYISGRKNLMSCGKTLTPYSWERAQKWAMENLDGDDYEEEFGEVEE